MANPIPEPYAWNESFRTFYELIDEEHKELFKSIFELSENRSSEQALYRVQFVMEWHFSDEQAIMKNAKYSDVANHIQMHDAFLNKLKGISLPASDEDINYAKTWLVDHIKTVDFKYKGKLGKCADEYTR